MDKNLIITGVKHVYKDKKVSVIISTYNRYDALVNAIESVKRQTYENIEIIVVNDCSTDERYYNNCIDDINLIHLEKNSREKLGFASAGYVRNFGLIESTGEYIAFLDDDDIWLENKIEIQLNEMLNRGYDFCCTEAFIGNGFYNQNQKYMIFHREYHLYFVKRFFKENYGKWEGCLPDIFNLELIEKHNFIINSSVLIKKDLLNKTGFFDNVKLGAEDYGLWLKCLGFTDCYHIKEPLLYYDGRFDQLSYFKRIKRWLRRYL
jgi:glycosyltransferase involved in cell wall biosynthesis